MTRKNKLTILGLTLFALTTTGLYSVYWFQASERAVAAYVSFIEAHSDKAVPPTPPEVSGFPGKIRLFVARDSFLQKGALIDFSNLEVIGWPSPGVPVDISADTITITPYGAPIVIPFDTFAANFTYYPRKVDIQQAVLSNGEFRIGLNGGVVFDNGDPLLDLIVTAENHTQALNTLLQAGVIEPKAAMMINAGLGVFRDKDGNIRLPLTTNKNGRIMAGPIPVGRL